MREVAVDLTRPGRYRLPAEADTVSVKSFDGAPGVNFLEVGAVYPTFWPLDQVVFVRSPGPTGEWYVTVVAAQPGCVAVLLMGGRNRAEVGLVERVAPVKAHGISGGALAVGTVPVQGPNVVASPGQSIVVKADPANTASIFVGSSSAVTTASGFPLRAADALLLSVDNLADLWFVSGTAAQTVRFIVETVHRR